MIRLKNIEHITYKVPDLDRAEQFVTDFGMTKVARTDSKLYMRGASASPYCYVAELAERAEYVSAAFAVESLDELRKAEELPGATRIETIDAPGGGKRVSVRDKEGFRIDLVHGQAQVEPMALRDPLKINFAREKNRLGTFQRLDIRPAKILRLGHFGYNVSSFDKAFDWYTSVFNFLPSDILYANPEGKRKNIAAFLRLDRGDEWVDHHSLFFLESPTTHVHHSSFEVQDFDEEMVGSQFLQSKGWQQFWGVGRHVLGSQIFDYWKDPSGFTLEHYADGDLMQANAPADQREISHDALSVWGPPPPNDFFD